MCHAELLEGKSNKLGDGLMSLLNSKDEEHKYFKGKASVFVCFYL